MPKPAKSLSFDVIYYVMMLYQLVQFIIRFSWRFIFVCMSSGLCHQAVLVDEYRTRVLEELGASVCRFGVQPRTWRHDLSPERLYLPIRLRSSFMFFLPYISI